MSKVQGLCGIFIAFSLALLAMRPDVDVALAVVALSVLFGAVTLIEKKQDEELELLTSQVKDLKNKVDALLLNKGFGR